MKLSLSTLIQAIGTISVVIAFPTGVRPVHFPGEGGTRLATRTQPGGRITNAQRFQSGLPPLPPKPRASRTRRNEASQTPISGVVTVWDLSGSVPVSLGSVSTNPGLYGCWGIGMGAPMKASSSYSGSAQSGRQLAPSNANSPYPYLGAVLLFPKLTPTGDETYACLSMVDGQGGAGNTLHAPFSGSDIWRVVKDPVYNGVTYHVTALSAVWDNKDGTYATNFFYDTGRNLFYVGALPAANYVATIGAWGRVVPIAFIVG